ncbi:Solute carrier family 38 member [Seminavis robusta]|uniref:Solute carrier family 38 member n=1 Tax=Seminavis robusta TaxID=568900 RepID=A0A9N8H328_9STRA|nr:Solute carrier family 38 member [Seminavis robusta]|eukprot:Sro79_g042630.1 Solute carrier family 38 member (769) ;mRNA; f:16134-18440
MAKSKTKRSKIPNNATIRREVRPILTSRNHLDPLVATSPSLGSNSVSPSSACTSGNSETIIKPYTPLSAAGLTLDGTTTTTTIPQTPHHQQPEDPLANPARFATHHHNNQQKRVDAPSFQIHMTTAQFKQALDRFGTETEETTTTRRRNFITMSSPLHPSTPASTASSNCSVMTGAVACLCSATLGAGILALPYAMAEAGLVCGMGLLLLSAMATAFSIQLLVQAMQVVYYHSHNNMTTKEKTYEDLVEICLGTTARRIAEASMLLFCGGGAVSYVIAVGDIVQQSGLLEHLASSLSPTAARALAMTVVWILAMVPLSMLRTMKSLECTSSIGIASIATLVVAALYHYLEHHTQQPQEQQQLLNDDHQSILAPTQGILSVLRACPIILFAFSCQVNVCAIYDEMKGDNDHPGEQGHHHNQSTHELTQPPQIICNDEETPTTSSSSSASPQQPQQQSTNATNFTSKYRRMILVTWIAVGICALLYSSISIIALLDFGSQHMTPNILSSYNPESIMQVAFIGMALAVVLAYPLNIFPARATLLGMCRTSQQENNIVIVDDMPASPTASFSHNNNNALTEPLLANDDNNSTSGSFHSAASAHHDEAASAQHDEATLATSNVAMSPTRHNNHFDIITDETTADAGWLGHVAVTLFLTGASLGLAIVAPNISVVFGLLGGTCTSVMGFILPGLLGYMTANDFYQVDQNDNNNEANRGAAARTRVLSLLLVVAGVLIGIITTAVTVYSTFIATTTQPQHNNNSILTLATRHHNS